MKRRIMKSLVCLMMILTMLMAPLSASAASVARIMKVTGDYVRMHNDPDGYGSFVHLRKGTKVLYWGSHDDEMYKVMTSSGRVGYVYRYYLTTYGAMRLDKVYITTASTQMYKRSGSGLAKNGVLTSGKYVMVYKTSGNWAYVKTMSGKGAFVELSNLRRAF